MCIRDRCCDSNGVEKVDVPKPSLIVIGSGAREHALLRAASQSRLSPRLHCFGTSNNPGMMAICEQSRGCYQTGAIDDPAAVLAFAMRFQDEQPMVLVGPEAPLEAGVVDTLEEARFGVVGPKRRLAMLETSKHYTRELMHKHMIPGRCRFKHFTSMEGVSEFMDELGLEYVVKDDGLCGGKGVKVSGDHLKDKEAGLEECERILRKGLAGEGSSSLVIEEKLVGQEFSIMSFCDGEHLAHMPAVQDHKRAYDGDEGPNTGGMGSYTDASGILPWLTPADVKAARDINEKVAKALLEEEGAGYKGVLYGQFMATKHGVNVIEYNARFGDPEALNLMALLDSDLITICQGICQGTLTQDLVSFKPVASVCKYKVPDGYPEHPVKGEPIDVTNINFPQLLYLASVDKDGEILRECGSRTAAVVGLGESIGEAEAAAEAEVQRITGPLFHRKDIGASASLKARESQMSSLRGVHVSILAKGDDPQNVAALVNQVEQNGGTVRAVIYENNVMTVPEQGDRHQCYQLPAPHQDQASLEASVCSVLEDHCLSLIHISEPTRLLSISYAVFCLKKKKHHKECTYEYIKHTS
eukprot:TRINITY_DN6762_c0_g1_i2.p1 TRINITY_DN6762_c0_g1~~TRINITY_DN6762_c0_g1_i2.p1  ORF type:complete len:584 (-),score=153.40 TRINITY_DN6762_c0_g1_i2:16-1767(-)